jgi:predicted Zn finger-like uncharacterized protein
MSLVTCCPKCATTFKVVRDQLRISDGWVRCGRCGEVFDATLDLRGEPEQPVAPGPSPSLTIVASEEPPPKAERLRERWPASDMLSLSDEEGMAAHPLAPPPRPFQDIDLSLDTSPLLPPPLPPLPAKAVAPVRDAAKGGAPPAWAICRCARQRRSIPRPWCWRPANPRPVQGRHRHRHPWQRLEAPRFPVAAPRISGGVPQRGVPTP